MPNFCKNSNILLLIVFVALMAVLVELIQNTVFSVNTTALITIYLFWMSLTCAGFLCFSSRVWKGRQAAISKMQWLVLFIACLALFSVMELIIQYYFYKTIDLNRFFRYFLIAIIVLFVVFRGFSLFDVFKIRAQAETVSHLQALQARIEPHFLFNSLNTIAELTHIDSKQAEEAIQSLSSLIRNSLNDESLTHSLDDEIQFCKQYIHLEKWRLGDRLQVVWDIQVDNLEKIMIPKLLIQPLIENAIVHGIAPLENGGSLLIKMSQNKKMLNVVVENKYLENTMESNVFEKGRKDGLGIALKNIKERLFVLYDDNHAYNVRRTNGLFTVSLELPY